MTSLPSEELFAFSEHGETPERCEGTSVCGEKKRKRKRKKRRETKTKKVGGHVSGQKQDSTRYAPIQPGEPYISNQAGHQSLLCFRHQTLLPTRKPEHVRGFEEIRTIICSNRGIELSAPNQVTDLP